MPRVVIDTNVFISAVLHSRAVPGRIIQELLNGRIQAVTSPYLIQELVEVSMSAKLSRYFRVQESVASIVQYLRANATLVNGIPTQRVVEHDPDDDYVLACAAEGSADYIISGDSHLLSLGQYRGVPIVSPSQFIQALEELSRG